MEEEKVSTKEELFNELLNKARNLENAERRRPLVDYMEGLRVYTDEMQQIMDNVWNRSVERGHIDSSIKSEEDIFLVPIEEERKKRSFFQRLLARINGDKRREDKQIGDVGKKTDPLKKRIEEIESKDKSDMDKLSQIVSELGWKLHRVDEMPISMDIAIEEYKGNQDGKSAAESFKKKVEMFNKEYNNIERENGSLPKPTIDQARKLKSIIYDMEGLAINAKADQIHRYEKSYEQSKTNLAEAMGIENGFDINHKDLLNMKVQGGIQIGSSLDIQENEQIMEKLLNQSKDKSKMGFTEVLRDGVRSDNEYIVTGSDNDSKVPENSKDKLQDVEKN